jgi:3-oxoacyl-[acyl-carrier protein] reductase
MSTLNNKIALVTGASKGIGAAIARHLALAGATVVVNYATSRPGAEKVVAEITAAGGKAVAMQGDFSNEADILRMFAKLRDTHHRLDILVNNAGVYAMSPIEQVTAAEFHRQFDLNVLGLLLATKAALPMFGTDGGSIINIGSAVATMSPPNAVVYSATKGAVDSITTSLSKELGGRGIRVNSLNPGLVKTEGTESGGMLSGEFETFITTTTPLGRIGRPGDIAKIAVFLASDAAAWVTGQHIIAAGGQTM